MDYISYRIFFIVIVLIIVFLYSSKIIYDFRYLNANFIILQNLLFLSSIVLSRIIIQKLYFHETNLKKSKVNTIIFGAGNDGINLYRRLKNSSKYNFVGFVDEDINKIGRFADDLKIYSLLKFFL